MIRDIMNEETGRLFRARIVMEGDAYGKDMCLIHDGAPLIEFYDATHDHSQDPDGRPLGQFVSRYYMDTLLGKDRLSGGSIFAGDTGLNLDGGIDAWSIDGRGMADVEIMLLEEGFIDELESQIALVKYAKKTDDGPGL